MAHARGVGGSDRLSRRRVGTGPDAEGDGDLGQGHERLEDHADLAGRREPAPAAGDRRPRQRLQGPQGPGSRLRPLRALASVSPPRNRRARGAQGRQDFLGLHRDRSHDDRFPRGHQGAFHHLELQHDSAVDVQVGQARRVPGGSRRRDVDVHAGERVQGPDLQGSGRLLRAPSLLVHEGRLHRRAGEAPRVGASLLDSLLGGAERAGPRAQPRPRGLHTALRRGGHGHAGGGAGDEVRRRLPRLPERPARLLRALPEPEEPQARHPARLHLVPLLRGARGRPGRGGAAPRLLRPGRRLPQHRALRRGDPEASVAVHAHDHQRDRVHLRRRSRSGCARARDQADSGLLLEPGGGDVRLPVRRADEDRHRRDGGVAARRAIPPSSRASRWWTGRTASRTRATGC